MSQTTPSQIWNHIKEAGQNVNVEASIYRVPKGLRGQNKNAYTPYLVSIGPLHSNDQRLNPGIKKHCVCLFLQRIKEGTNKKKIDVIGECLVEMRNLREDAKKSYGEKVDKSLTDKMMFIDGCFILEVLYRYHERFSKYNRNSPAGLMMNVVESNKSSGGSGGGDLIFGSSRMDIGIKHDLLLLENQLPFKVLETLYTLTLAKILPDHLPNGCRSLTHFVRLYFGDVMGVYNPEEKCCSSGDSFIITVDGEKPTVKENFLHLLHVVHNRYLPPKEYRSEIKSRSAPVSFVRRCNERNRNFAGSLTCSKKAGATVAGNELMRSATDLDFAGVKFQARSSSPSSKEEDVYAEASASGQLCRPHIPPQGSTPGVSMSPSPSYLPQNKKEEVPLLKVDFHEPKGIFWWWRRARFEIPALDVNDATEPFLRNLIAFEYCCTNIPNHFTWYATVMDHLINTEDDVKVLEKDGVLSNNLGDYKVVAKMFNNLCKEVCLWELYFDKECHRAVDHSKKCYRKAVAQLRRKWFGGPWTFVAFLVAAIAFLMSITQFVRSFLR